MAKNTLPEDNLKDGSGRKEHQRMKHFLVYMYLLKYTDEAHPAKAETIAEFLKEQGIFAERRSIYKDIEELNLAYILMTEPDCYSIEEATEILDEDKELTAIKYKHPKGFYMSRRPLTLDDAMLLAQCVYTARFIPKGTEKRLLDGISTFLSEEQAENIYEDVFLVDRTKTNNKEIFFNVEQINLAKDNKKKIQFKYLKYDVNELKKQVERKHGDNYTVSPYKVIINDGNYYLLGLNEKQKIITYRIDRMKNVKVLNISREEAVEYKELMRDIESYTRRVFSMYGGDRQSVEIRFINPLLDTVIDRFGTSAGTTYSKVDENHFSVRTSIEVSDQFFAWVCGFGKKAKITYPESVLTAFKDFLNKIQSIY